MEEKEKVFSKTRAEYIKNIEIGSLVAFKVKNRMLSAKVVQVNENDLKVEAKNGSIYFIGKEAVAWVRTGRRWPAGIWNALKDNVN